MTKTQAYTNVVKTLQKERAMRVRVFRGDTKKLTEKVREIDDALACLRLLEPEQIKYEQPRLPEEYLPTGSGNHLYLFDEPVPQRG